MIDVGYSYKRSILYGIANNVLPASSTNSILWIRKQVGQYLKKNLINNTLPFTTSQAIATRCLELFPDGLKNTNQIQNKVEKFIEEYPDLSGSLYSSKSIITEYAGKQ